MTSLFLQTNRAGENMEREKIIGDLRVLFLKVMGTPRLKITEDTTDEDIDEWESIAHIQLIDAIEKYYKIRFSTPEIQAHRKVSTLVTFILAKLERPNP